MFLETVSTQAIDAVGRAEPLTDLRERYRILVQDTTRGSANQLVDLAFEQPVLTARIVEKRLGITRPSSLAALRILGRPRNPHRSCRRASGSTPMARP